MNHKRRTPTWLRHCCVCHRLFRVPRHTGKLKKVHECDCGAVTIYGFSGRP